MFGVWKDIFVIFSDLRRARKRRVQTRNELHSLTDRELSDIGIARSQINEIV